MNILDCKIPEDLVEVAVSQGACYEEVAWARGMSRTFRELLARKDYWNWMVSVRLVALNLGGADLSGANLRRANLGGADLSEANLWGVIKS